MNFASNYAMCGRLMIPSSSMPGHPLKLPMGGEQAAKTMLQIQVAAMRQRRSGNTGRREKILDKITDNITARQRRFMRLPVYGWMRSLIPVKPAN